MERENSEQEKHTKHGGEHTQEQVVDTVRLPRGHRFASKPPEPTTPSGSSQISEQDVDTVRLPRKRYSVPVTPAPISSRPDQISEQDVDTVRLPHKRYSVPVTPASPIPSRLPHIPQTETSSLLSEELAGLSTAVSDSGSAKQVPPAQRIEPKITQPLRTPSLLAQRRVAMNSRGARWLWPVIVIFSGIAAGLVNFVFTASPLRPFIVLWFLFVCPGMILVRFLRLKEPVVEWVLALVLSFAIDALVASIQLYAGWWSPSSTLSVILCLSLGAAIVQFVPIRAPAIHRVRLPHIAASSLVKLSRIMATPRVNLPHVVRSKKSRMALGAAFTVLIAIIVAINFWPYASYPRSHSASVESQHGTSLHSAPKSQPTSIGDRSYYGTIYNLATNVSTAMSLTYLYHQGKISGTFTGLHLNGPFTGTIDSANRVQITVTENAGGMLLSLNGMVRSNSYISGSYCSLDQSGRCDGKYGYGIWAVAPSP